MSLRVGLNALCVLLVTASSASAHVVLEKSEATPGAFYKAVLKVTHGCEGSPTVKVEVTLPEGVIAAKPMPKPGWDIAIEKGAFARAYKFHGRDVAEGVTSIVWSGGPLPDDYYDEFVFSAYLAGELASPATLYFPVVQTCSEGKMGWIETPAKEGGPAKLTWPAPGLKLLAPEGGGNGHAH